MEKSYMNKFILRMLAIVVGLSLLFIFSSCSKSGKSKSPRKPESVPVTVAAVIQKDIPLQLNTIGSVESYSTISVVSQVGGTLLQVKFQEGQEVKKGELLFVIDPEPFQLGVQQAEAEFEQNIAQHAQAEANYVRDSVQLENAKVELQRAADLLQAGVITQEEYDQTKTSQGTLSATLQADRAAIKTSEAVIGAARAAVETAKILLGYCSVRAPMSGRTGSLLVNQGTVVKANDKPLIVINQLNPIYVSFSIPEQELPKLKKYMGLKTLKVEAIIPNESEHRVAGTLSFLDNAVDRTTGTIRLKAVFANADRRLWPGQFVSVVLTLATESNAVVVPTEAVQTGQDGQFVFIVKSDNTVESRPIIVRRTYQQESLIEQGLQPGETVVTDGQLRLTPGAKIEIRNAVQSPKS
jgi:multidrug efflux system membrane fusion protein